MMAPCALFFLLQLGFKEISTYAIYGTGAFFAGWFLSAVVSVLDSIPLVSSYQVLHKRTILCPIEELVTDCSPAYLQLPKILEIVGLGYTIWFGTRYLLFKVSVYVFIKQDSFLKL
jgi:hypothetical protein